jgi:hypothetical protein
MRSEIGIKILNELKLMKADLKRDRQFKRDVFDINFFQKVEIAESNELLREKRS